jgi:N-acetyltransferase
MSDSHLWQPTLENEALLLRPLHPDDFENLYAVASDPLLWEQHPAKDRYERPVFDIFFQEALASQGALVAIDKKTQQVIGSSRYYPVPETTEAIEIGWTFLTRAYWGGHFNGMMKKLMLEYAFQHVETVVFYVNEHNLRSQKAVEKIGGTRISAINGVPIAGRPASNVIFAINRAS